RERMPAFTSNSPIRSFFDMAGTRLAGVAAEASRMGATLVSARLLRCYSGRRLARLMVEDGLQLTVLASLKSSPLGSDQLLQRGEHHLLIRRDRLGLQAIPYLLQHFALLRVGGLKLLHQTPKLLKKVFQLVVAPQRPKAGVSPGEQRV